MEFIIDRYVTGKDFIGRRGDANIISNLLAQGENVTIYEPPKTGKKSLVHQAFNNMNQSYQTLAVAEVNLLNVRSIADLCTSLGSSIIKCSGLSESEFSDAVGRYLPGTHFVFDSQIFASRGLALSLNWDIDDSDIRAVFSLPYLIAADRGLKMFVYFEEFQNVFFTEDGDKVCRIMNDVFKARTPEDRRSAAYILTGSRVNAMKEIFKKKHCFLRQVEHVNVSEIDTRDLTDYAVRIFSATGKVIDRGLMSGACGVFRNNVWYLNQFWWICDSLSRGYIMEPILVGALKVLVAMHEPKFRAIMNDLTTFQVGMLRAIVDGVTKFSSADVISHYNLNSSANVLRLKEALCRKEVVTFDESDSPHIIDPLFEYWVSREYFQTGR